MSEHLFRVLMLQTLQMHVYTCHRLLKSAVLLYVLNLINVMMNIFSFLIVSFERLVNENYNQKYFL